MKFVSNYIVILSFVLFTACSGSQNEIVLHQIKYSTYTDEIVVEGTVEALQSSTITCPRRLDGTIVYLAEDGAFVKEGDTVCVLENRQAENFFQNTLDRVEQYQAQYEKGKANLEMQYAMLQAQVQTNQAQTSISNLDSVQLQYLSVQDRKIKELELKKTAIEKRKLERKLELLELINESELKKLQLQIKQQESEVDRIKGILDQLIMLAPQDGMVMRSNSRRSDDKVKEGDEVWGGMPLLDIPDKTRLKVTILASEADYKRINEKDSVVFTFNGMPGNLAWGKIDRKAPMGKPFSRNSKVKVFEITASVDSFKVLPELGLSANCRVILEEVKDTLVIPQLAVFEEDSMKVVYQKEDGRFVRREVLLAENSPKLAVVAFGVAYNNELALQKPASALIRSTVLINDSIKTRFEAIEKATDSVQTTNVTPPSVLPEGLNNVIIIE